MAVGLARGAAIAVVLASAFAASPASAQQLSGRCTLSDNFRTVQRMEISAGIGVVYIGLADLRCPDGLRIRADSAVVYEQSGRNELIGNVRFTTPERDLRSDLADWYEREGQLLARGNVVFGDLTEGTEVRGESLDYLEGREGREEQVTVSGGRPSATLPAEARDDGSEGLPFRVTANRLRFQGERFFWGDGEVEVDREDLRAQADSLVYDRESEFLILNRDAEVVRGDVLASGQNLNLTFVDDRLRSLVARNGGRIETAENAITGLMVEVTLNDDEEVDMILAEGGEAPGTGDRVVATLEGDNLLVRGQRIQVADGDEGTRVLTATGAARAEALGEGFGAGSAGADGPGPGAPAPPEADERTGPAAIPGEADLVGLADRDWIEGEEIVALFEAVPAPEGAAAGAAGGAPGGDPAAGPEGEEGWRLVRLESIANAAALYRTEPDEEAEADEADEADAAAADAPPAAADTVAAPGAGEPDDAEAPRPGRRFSITYVLADRIVIYLEDGDVRLLEAEGVVRGIQLEPTEGGAG